MRWLMIVLLVSLGALLIAVGGLARHILRQRALHRSEAAGTHETAEDFEKELKP